MLKIAIVTMKTNSKPDILHEKEEEINSNVCGRKVKATRKYKRIRASIDAEQVLNIKSRRKSQLAAPDLASSDAAIRLKSGSIIYSKQKTVQRSDSILLKDLEQHYEDDTQLENSIIAKATALLGETSRERKKNPSLEQFKHHERILVKKLERYQLVQNLLKQNITESTIDVDLVKKWISEKEVTKFKSAFYNQRQEILHK
jgi:hypothetical protein